ncbi:MAG TPA: hypothetical protein VFZ25_01800, partial [Chloroflexota bacterium]|nr:hypothetical protein [Chloroflexota bacterium]
MDPNLLASLFTVCFWFGAAAIVLTFVFGIDHHGPGHLPHVGGDVGHGSINGHVHAGPHVTPINLSSILAFLLVFGAVGLILPSGIGALIVLVLASLGGLFAGWLVFLFFARFLARGQSFLADEPIAGTLGQISIPIAPAHVGEVIYTRNGVRHSDGARSADGQAIGVGEEVVIVGYTDGIAMVQRWRDYVT